jgi:hypothetical protein
MTLLLMMLVFVMLYVQTDIMVKTTDVTLVMPLVELVPDQLTETVKLVKLISIYLSDNVSLHVHLPTMLTILPLLVMLVTNLAHAVLDQLKTTVVDVMLEVTYKMVSVEPSHVTMDTMDHGKLMNVYLALKTTVLTVLMLLLA